MVKIHKIKYVKHEQVKTGLNPGVQGCRDLELWSVWKLLESTGSVLCAGFVGRWEGKELQVQVPVIPGKSPISSV